MTEADLPLLKDKILIVIFPFELIFLGLKTVRKYVSNWKEFWGFEIFKIKSRQNEKRFYNYLLKFRKSFARGHSKI